jgi:hypothetical protein
MLRKCLLLCLRRNGIRLNKWASLKLWVDIEEKEIHDCLEESLKRLARSKNVKAEDEETQVTGKLRPFLFQVKKERNLVWTISPEASTFSEITNSIPSGHPDIRFSGNTPDFDQYDYDIECKLVRDKRIGKKWDYCAAYVVNGIKRFQDCIYSAALPAMGMMVGYVQEGNLCSLFEEVQQEVTKQHFGNLNIKEWCVINGVSKLTELLTRVKDKMILHHIWIDLR